MGFQNLLQPSQGYSATQPGQILWLHFRCRVVQRMSLELYSDQCLRPVKAEELWLFSNLEFVLSQGRRRFATASNQEWKD